MDLPSSGFTDRLLQTAGKQPGILAVGGTTGIPLSGSPNDDVITAVGYTPKPGESLIGHPTYGVFGDYFSAIGIPLIERPLSDRRG